MWEQRAEEVRKLVKDNSLTYTWLIHRLAEKGLQTDKFEMSATLSGTRRGKKADEILEQSVHILRDYQARIRA